jgi:branched-chain amino acid transport system permease protein
MDRRPAIPIRYLVVGALLLVLAVVPLLGETFYTRLATRIMIYGICALSLDLILGYGGMVSFGHAAYFGAGAYAVGLLSFYGVNSAWVAWPVAILCAAVLAFIIGLVCLRTTGVYFIMITLAFAQMLYYFFSSLEAYGGDDGMALYGRNVVSESMDLGNHTVFFYVVFTVLLLALWISRRLVHSRFGTVIRGIRENETRMRAIGFPVFRYKLVCFVIAGGLAGLSGVLIANQTMYISPALMHWTRSGDILIMVILGGLGSLIGPVLGAAGLLLAEEILSGYTEHWMVILGPMLILMVLYARNGIYGLVSRRGPR